MKLKLILLCSLFAIGLLSLAFCSVERSGNAVKELEVNPEEDLRVVPAAERTEEYLPLLEGLKVGILVNQSSLVGDKHLLDTLLSLGVEVIKVFSPEHGFRGDAADGETVESSYDEKTSVPIISLYGKNKKPSQEYLEGLDMVIFDIQDVGVRFYTYLSTLHLMMEACAEKDIPLIVFDRPNPNAWYIDGPVLDMEFSSFVGMHPVPIVYGMSIGEYARMINGEGWLDNDLQCSLTVIELEGWNHESRYELPVRPSPNLPNQKAVLLYPSLALFEGTIVSCGRGTDFPFRMIGYPGYPSKQHLFVPESKPGFSKNPKFEGDTCYGIDLRNYSLDELYERKQLNISLLLDVFSSYQSDEDFFRDYFLKLCGNETLLEDIRREKNEMEIRAAWKEELEKFKEIRKKYLIYD